MAQKKTRLFMSRIGIAAVHCSDKRVLSGGTSILARETAMSSIKAQRRRELAALLGTRRQNTARQRRRGMIAASYGTVASKKPQ